MSWAPFVLRERLTVAGRPVGPRHLVALEVVGDEVIPNQATEAWARVVGLEVLAPHMEVPEGIAEVASGAPADAGGQAVTALRRHVWGRLTTTTPPVPAGGAFAAHVLGFAAPGSDVTVWTSGRWTRLSTPTGHVLVR